MLLNSCFPQIRPLAASFIFNTCRRVFESRERGWLFTMPGNRGRRLYACEDPSTMGHFQIGGSRLPLPQSLQMGLEEDLLLNPGLPGIWTYGISHRNEATAGTDSRRNLMFPMIEFECHGGLDELLRVYDKLFAALGFSPTGPNGEFPRVSYSDACDVFDVTEIDAAEEMKLAELLGPVVFLVHFPESTNPFWNMRRDPKTGLAAKCDVIVAGREAAGSAERETDIYVMRDRFYSIEDGEYARTLENTLGDDVVTQELDEYLRLKFFKRSGAGLGITRILQGAYEAGVLPNAVMSEIRSSRHD